MRLIHSVNREVLIPILREGIKRGIDLPSEKRKYPQSNPEWIYLTAIRELSYEALSSSRLYSFNEEYHIFVKPEWIEANISLLMERAEKKTSSEEFYNWTKKMGISKSDQGPRNDDYFADQVVCTEPIPIEGIEALLIKGDPDFDGCDCLNLRGLDTKGINPKKIYKIGTWYDEFVNIRNIMPKGIKLYAGNEKQTKRIK